MNVKQRMNAFFIYLREVKNVSDNTFCSYERDITKLMEFLMDQGIDSWSKLNETNVTSYILYLERTGYSSATIARTIASVRSFVYYLIKMREIDEDPTERVHAPKVEKRSPVTLTIEQVDQLLNAPDMTTLKGIRDKAMLELMYATGMKVSELLSLSVQDINLQYKIVTCRQQTSERLIPIGSEAFTYLNDYIMSGRERILNEKQTNYLFTNRKGEPMSRQGFWKMIKVYAKKVELDCPITPQIIRHSFALHLIQNGADVNSVGEMLGYQDLSLAYLYCQKTKSKVWEEYQKAHPKA